MLVRKPFVALIANHLVFYPTPSNLTYFWGFGSLAGLMLASQVLTGVFLAMHYTPSVEIAFGSIDHIMRDVTNGWLVRYVHANGASFFFLVVYLHLGRTLFFAFYQNLRAALWYSGVLLFVLMMATAFLGYVLPWGQMSFWGATVITNLFTAVPLVGESIAFWLWGGFSVANATLVRFFSLHYLLPFVIVGGVGVHLAALHTDGSLNPLGTKNVDRVFFFPYFYVKDYFGFLGLVFVFGGFVVYAPDLLGHSDNYIEANALVTPAHIVPEWYFLPFYAILRGVPSKLGGVLLMALALGVLLVLPMYRFQYRSLLTSSRYSYIWLFWFFSSTILILGMLGGSAIEDPYPLFSQLFTFFYFSFFTIGILGDFRISSGSYVVNPARYAGFHQAVRGRQWAVQQLDQRFVGKRALGEKLGTGTVFLPPNHPYHLVNASPWPFVIACGLVLLPVGAVLYFHQYVRGLGFLELGLFALVGVLCCWFRDIIREATFEGWHTQAVQRGLKLGMILFIVSEVMFFFSFFWAFFHSSLAPAIQIGGIWPPKGIVGFNPWQVPLLNTVILLTSGVTVTWAHYAIRGAVCRRIDDKGLLGCLCRNVEVLNYLLPKDRVLSLVFPTSRAEVLIAVGLTVLLGVVFTCIQYFEYKHAPFTISDSVYGSTFFLTTGFHGLHVLVGTLLLLISFMRVAKYHFTRSHHVGFESAIWYWHFVDVVWLGLYISVYHWGGNV